MNKIQNGQMERKDTGMEARRIATPDGKGVVYRERARSDLSPMLMQNFFKINVTGCSQTARDGSCIPLDLPSAKTPEDILIHMENERRRR